MFQAEMVVIAQAGAIARCTEFAHSLATGGVATRAGWLGFVGSETFAASGHLTSYDLGSMSPQGGR
ncbi:hypothetical protein HMPREF9946_00131 [Acetobacteraceae bacterium AT-5844]|nr:hypothetical protein HMPREF9946_00131 [Acetobacteraceae bacterium AT-5844]